MFKIGNVIISGYAATAPMASVGDYAFRRVCREQGSCYSVGEMASAKGFIYESEKTRELLEIRNDEHPSAVQIFGEDSEFMGKAAEKAALFGADIIDINMGCPVPKVAGSGSGAALMKDMKKAEAIIKAVKASSPVPVTVKFRAGWDKESINAPEFAKMAEEAGADAVTVHCRTKAEMYAFPVDISVIGRVKEAVGIPVIGNGGISSAADAKRMFSETGCDLVMVGNGALGNPFIFREINALMEKGTELPPADVREKTEMLLYQARLAIEDKGEKRAMNEIRKHAMWYFSGQRGAAAFKREAGYVTSYKELEDICKRLIEAQG